MNDLRGWQLPEQHLLPDAIVAYVDGELTESARHRATAHIRTCLACTAEIGALRQARGAVRSAGSPTMPASLLASLRSIPESAELSAEPDSLAVTADGELVTVQRPDEVRTGGVGGTTPLGTSTPLGSGNSVLGRGRFGRRGSQGAGVVVSGLVLGALAFAAPHSPSAATTQPTSPERANPPAAVDGPRDKDRAEQRDQPRRPGPRMFEPS